MIILGIAALPQLVQITRQAAGGADDHIALAKLCVEHSDDFGLRNTLAFGWRAEPRHFCVPLLPISGSLLAVFGRDVVVAQRRREVLDSHASIADKRDRRMLECVEFSD